MLQQIKPDDSFGHSAKKSSFRYIEISYFFFVGLTVLFAFLSSVIPIVDGPNNYFSLIGKTILFSNKTITIDFGIFLVLFVFLLYIVKKAIWMYKQEKELL